MIKNALDKLEKKNQKSTRYVADIYIIFFIFILTAIILSVPHLLRDNSLINKESYYFLRIAESPLLSYDSLSYSGRDLIFNLWPALIYFISSVFNLSLIFTSKLLPYLFGILSAVLFYLILSKLNINIKTSLLATLILIISPPFIYLFTASNNHILSIFLILLSFYLILRKNFLISIIPLILIPFTSILASFISIILLLIYSLKGKTFKILIPIILLFLITLIPLFKYGIPEKINFDPEQKKTSQQFISDFGGKFGISLFAIFLSVFGFLYLWKEKYKHLPLYLSIIFLFILFFYEIKSIFYLNFLIAILASLGLINILTMKWESKTIKNLTSLILILGLIFSFISYENSIYKLPPNKTTISSLEYLKDISQKDDVVFSHYSKGIWINTIAKRKNVMDTNFRYAPNLNQRYIDSLNLFYTKDLKEATKIVNKYDIKYIYLDKELKNKLYQKEDQDLLFLLKYSKKFKKIYNQNNIEIWEAI